VSLTAKDVAEITRLLEESNFDELDLELAGLKLSLRRGSAASTRPLGNSATVAAQQSAALAHPERSSAATTPAPPTVAPATAPPVSDDPNTVDISAPLLGTFYRAPKPGAAPFVEVGSPVEEGTIVGIIEVMKLMNTVRAGVRGKVIQILGRDGGLVEYGETLMRIGRTT
jgi:acetyl-CoA carboxylase biotin carboxyl carrier protein